METSVPSEVSKVAVRFRKNVIKFIQSSLSRKIKDCDKKTLKVNLDVFLYNCILCSFTGKSFAISLDRNIYTAPAIRNGVRLKKKCSYTYTKKIIDFFVKEKLISLEVGEIKEWVNTRLPDGTWKHEMITSPSIITISQKLKNLCQDIEFKPETLKRLNVVILRDSTKNDITFKVNRDRKEEIVRMDNMNIRALKTEITKVDGGKYLLQLRKIYNQDFYTGGRLYDDAIQRMPKKERKLLIMNGEPVTLLDYKSFETSIAYTLCDEVMDGDPYEIEFEEYHPKVVRDVCKLIMTRIFNCQNRTTLAHLVNKHIHDYFNLDKLMEERKIPEKRIPVGMFIDILMQKHNAIEEYFFCNGEHNLQYIGSQIIDYVIECVMQNHDVMVIPVFDEIICQESIADDVKGYMISAYEAIFGNSLNVKVER